MIILPLEQPRRHRRPGADRLGINDPALGPIRLQALAWPAGNWARWRSCHAADRRWRGTSGKARPCSRTSFAPCRFPSWSTPAPALECKASAVATAPGRTAPACEAHYRRTKTLACALAGMAARRCGLCRWCSATDSTGTSAAIRDRRARPRSKASEAIAPATS